jgi:uncharacterized protein (DUF1810 family)
MTNADPFDLQRFTEAQSPVLATVLNELKQGQKHTHWIWFVFPQVTGLRSSQMAKHYAIHSREEARAYLGHHILGPRLIECTQAVLLIAGKSAHDIFGSPDDLKFRSSMTLFEAVGGQPLFRSALDRFYGGSPDDKTLAILAAWEAS